MIYTLYKNLFILSIYLKKINRRNLDIVFYNTSIMGKELMKNINFHSCIKVDHKIWFVSVEGYLMYFDTITYQSEIVVPKNLSGLHFGSVVDNMLSVDNEIYFVEQDGSKLYEYNRRTNDYVYYLIPDTEYINWGCFSGIYLFDRTIYLFTRTSDVIHCFDIINKKFTSIKTGKRDIVLNSFRIKNAVYLYGKKVLCFDMDSHFFIREFCPEEGTIFWMNSCQNTIFFLTKSRMGIWNKIEKNKEILYVGEKLSEKFSVFLTTENKIFLLPNYQKIF